MAIYGYHRTSTSEQHLDRGLKEIEDYCKQHNYLLTDIFTDQLTGKNFNRPEYQFLKKRILPQDIIIITELDRLSRNKVEILKELQYYKERSVRVMILEIPTTLIDYSSMDDSLASLMMETINNMLIEMFAVMAQSEIEKKEKRQREGIDSKKKRGEWKDYGRPSIISESVFAIAYEKIEQGDINATELRKELGLSHSTFYRYRKRYLENGNQ